MRRMWKILWKSNLSKEKHDKQKPLQMLYKEWYKTHLGFRIPKDSAKQTLAMLW
jgi:hypothetical protein